ncbi:hypothetical protein POTOM_026055 [Populus tomentosa]|uniref:Uncharacterized protein n=1 Tax=Populus tomentosa TaxID=118781 RepID=A0A8X8CZ32_POPTO|nr:hypothetical protein POTOM_026055 [Populus tomentosa]
MVHISFYRNYWKTFKKPRCPYEKERLDAELKLIGEMLLTLNEKIERRIFEGEVLLRRLNRYGFLEESQNKLDYVLALTMENFLERRLQTLVFKAGPVISELKVCCLFESLAHAYDCHPLLEKHVDFSLTSPFGGGRSRRVKRKNQNAASKKATGGDGDEEDEE